MVDVLGTQRQGYPQRSRNKHGQRNKLETTHECRSFPASELHDGSRSLSQIEN